MNKLSLELRRLYQPTPSADVALDPVTPLPLIDATGQVRALVLGLTRPADWAVLSPLWQGVQAELGWPAPAIAVDGHASLQLWFSLAEPLPTEAGAALLEALRRRYLPDTAPARVALWPRADATTASGWRHAGVVPAVQADGERWAAFVAPDLAAVFGDEPWIDLPPNLDGQAQLLAKLGSIRPDDAAALSAPDPAPQAVDTALANPAPGGSAARQDVNPNPATDEARRFLLQVMNDETTPLALRIDAARALLAAPGEATARR